MSIAIVLVEVFRQIILQKRYHLPIQHWTTSRSLILLHLPCSSSKSGREKVKLEITAITGVNSVRGRRVNGLHIQDIYNLFIYLFIYFYFLMFNSDIYKRK